MPPILSVQCYRIAACKQAFCVSAGRRKELENYCSKVLDEFEDDLIAALKKESGDLEGILCQQLAGACKPGSLSDVKSEL